MIPIGTATAAEPSNQNQRRNITKFHLIPSLQCPDIHPMPRDRGGGQILVVPLCEHASAAPFRFIDQRAV
jgi:hypothetical protein